MEETIHIRFKQLVDSKNLEKELELNSISGYKKISSKGFDGIEILTYMLSIGGAVATQIAAPLAKMIADIITKDKNTSVEIEGIKVTGFSFEETVKLLEKTIKAKQKIKKSNL
ncbi:MAG: hypothetical protein LBR70_02785 [Lactobacillaceae bacterium]|jgi:hypothetical protein|nr:hypothetical protein [Lactobacillaceae bacterium]